MSTEKMKPVKPSEVAWEPFEGGAIADLDLSDECYEIEVTGRQRVHTAYYNASRPNERAWSVGVYGGESIANGTSDGLGAAKRDALTALNTHRATTPGTDR